MVDKSDKQGIIKLSTQKHAGAGAKGVHTMTRTTATKDEEMKALRKITTATKDEERKALRQIRDIVEGLGSDSYLAISTEGFWGMAETNILDDTGNSVAQYRKCWEATSSENRELEKKIKELQDKNAKLEEAIKAAELDRKDILDLMFKEAQELKKENEAQKREIINLKAKLYDLITA